MPDYDLHRRVGRPVSAGHHRVGGDKQRVRGHRGWVAKVMLYSPDHFSPGGCLGHTVCTGAAVLFGMIVAKFISARFLTLIGKDDTSLHV